MIRGASGACCNAKGIYEGSGDIDTIWVDGLGVRCVNAGIPVLIPPVVDELSSINLDKVVDGSFSSLLGY